MSPKLVVKQIKKKIKIKKKKKILKFKKKSRRPHNVLIFQYLGEDTSEDNLGSEYGLKKFHILTRNYFKRISYFFKNKIIYLLFNKSFLKYNINIIFFQNNLVCSITDIKKDKILYLNNIEDHKIKISHKLLKFQYRKLLAFFFKKIRNLKNNYNNTMFCVTAPKRFKKKIVLAINKLFKKRKFIRGKYRLGGTTSDERLIIRESLDKSKMSKSKYFNQLYIDKNILINIKHKKSFNGCRLSRKKR